MLRRQVSSGYGFGRLLGGLPGATAIFSVDGLLVKANEQFLRYIASGASTRFQLLFGDHPEAFVAGSDPIRVGDRYLAISALLQPLLGWVVQAHDATKIVEDSKAASSAATQDLLTGLANRAAVLPELERARRERKRLVAVLMIDLDRFKAVNDTLGHAVGDQLLIKVAKRLEAIVQPSYVLARLGGDEFVAIQFDEEQPASAASLAKRTVDVISRPYIVDGHMIDIGASVGIAIGSEIDPEQLLKQADIALYRAKQSGRGRYTFFEQSMDDEMQERRSLEIDLRRALAFREFKLHYQPQLSLASRRVTGMEALIRWQHPTKGLVAPDRFVPLAEETGLIIPIGEWVIHQACEDASVWTNDLSIAVNVSAKQLVSGKLVKTVSDALSNTRLDPRRLEIEITETVLMGDNPNTLETLHALRAMGVKVSMDDFGTGYSSLSYLSSFPFDKIKIDQSFVRAKEPEKADGIIRAITAIGNHLGMLTIAEGVETAEQFCSLAETGCGSVQGFLVSKAVPASEVPDLLERLAREPLSTPHAIEERSKQSTDLHRLVYYSRNAIMGVDEEVVGTVAQILSTSQRNNASVGVTGALMFTDGFFAQVLEGERSAVETVFDRIQLDDRHSDVHLLSFEPVQQRIFSAWSMAFVGSGTAGQAKFGHYAADSSFDFSAADADVVCRHLRKLLEEEETRAIAA